MNLYRSVKKQSGGGSVVNILPDTDTNRWSSSSSGVTINSSGNYSMDVTFSAKLEDVHMTFNTVERTMLAGKSVHVQINTGTFVNTALELVVDNNSVGTITQAGQVINALIPSDVTEVYIRTVANQTAETWTASFTGLLMCIIA